MKKISYILLGFLFAIGITVYAAPSLIYQSTIIPLSNNQYDLGTSTQKWRDIYTQNITISGTCTGCSSFSYPFTNTSYGGSTTTIIGFLGGLIGNSASSTITNLFTTNSTTTNATSTNNYVLTDFWVASLTSAITLTGSDGKFAEYTGSSNPCTNQLPTTISALGALGGCVSVSNAMLSNSTISGIALGSNLADLTATNGTLTFSGTYNGSTARTIGLNLSNENIWISASTTYTGGITIGTATTTNATTTNLYFSGQARGVDKATGFSGIVSPIRVFGGQTGTTTTWTATTSKAYEWYAPIPFAGTLKTVMCSSTTTASFLGITPYINTTQTSPSYFVASTTEGVITFTGNNTFISGDVIGFSAGTTTTDTNAYGVSCTFTAVQTI